MCSGGKMLQWAITSPVTNAFVLDQPVRGLILKRPRGDKNVQGGLSFDKQSDEPCIFIIGSESGGIFRINISSAKSEHKMKLILDKSKNQGFKWNSDAQLILELISNQNNAMDIKNTTEKYCKENKINVITGKEI